MKSRDFCFWLQGFFELSRAESLDKAQVTLIRQHLALVFKHEIDPSAGSAEHQAELNEIHHPPKPNSGAAVTGANTPGAQGFAGIGGRLPDGTLLRC